jgi:DNA modification methylase
MFSFVGDTVLDPFAGTGSTIISAAATGRNSIGIEIDPGYLEFAYRRLRKQGIMIETPQSVKQYQRTLTGD